MKKQFTFFTVLVCAFSLYAQKPKEVLKWINTVNTHNKDFYYEIPFEYRNNEIVIKVTIGGEEYDYIFDTGGYNNITDAIQQKNNFPILTKQTVGSANRIKTKINIVKMDTLKIGELVFTDIAALQMNFDNSPILKCTIDGGLIGASIIKKFVWQIDFTRKKIIVTNDIKKLSGIQNAFRLPVTFNSRLMPYLTVKINDKKETMMFDLGNPSLFTMNNETAKKYTKSANVIEIQGGGTEGGNGELKENVYVFKAQTVDIGAIKYTDKQIIFTESLNENLIGNSIIKDYIVTMNFNDDEIYFSPISNSNKVSTWQSFGFTLGYEDGKVRIATIYKGLQAEKVELSVGDEVILLDGKAPECNNFCDCRELNDYLAERDIITITVLKGGIEKNIILEKKNVF